MDWVNKNQVFGTKYPILFLVFTWERKRERKRASKPSFDDSRSSVGLEFIKPRIKVHRLDESFTHIPKKRDFTEDPNDEI